MLRRGCEASSRRRHPSDSLSWQQDQALSSSIYLLREIGPTGFLLREEEPENGDFRVFLGNPHVCNCSTFLKGRELCKHICWILLKKFRLPRNHESAFQLGLTEGAINDLLLGIHRVQTPQVARPDDSAHGEGDGYVQQKEVGPEDICSICQEELLEKRLPVTFCRFGCGNNVHIKCMKILANYQNMTSSSSMVKCPLCRKEFAPLKVILEEFRNSSKLMATTEKERLDKHLGIHCNHCEQFPIKGKCYKCTECVDYHLCQKCFDSSCHAPHTFSFREKRNQRWCSLEKKSHEDVKYLDIKSKIEEKMPHYQEKEGEVYTPKHVVKSLPLLLITKNSKLLAPGCQCRLCLKSFQLGQHMRLLPCSHKFHRKCIDSWLFHKCNACPIDGLVIHSPLIWKSTAMDAQGYKPASRMNITHLSKQEELKFLVPGTRLILKQNRPEILPTIPQSNSEKLNTLQSPTNTYQDITIDDLCSVKLEGSNSRKLLCEHKISQHFPRYLQDLPTGPLGKISPQTFLPSIAQKSTSCHPETESFCGPKRHSGLSQKVTKHVSHKEKRMHSTTLRRDNRRSNILLPEELNLVVNGNVTNLSVSKRCNNYKGKIRPKCHHLSRQPVSYSSNTQSTALSLIMEGVRL
ncbi:PREDICTED: E3 ubiquitin-protein ligase ZSWIM2 isoform X2 [Chinchilla lanigera]|uniref:RING-type E3 ubiquitin transferase n=1 Tax=Chinchilla lanigera TaxID=34839 RepID=A0A8C2W149_CHILA|nr:PREDICTED: E3 ubiquitin-protein ligase ZSWIM2 isoform X2 [Chinchilla lanigera]